MQHKPAFASQPQSVGEEPTGIYDNRFTPGQDVGGVLAGRAALVRYLACLRQVKAGCTVVSYAYDILPKILM